MQAAYRSTNGVMVDFNGPPTEDGTELCLAHQLLAAGLSRARVDQGLPDHWRGHDEEPRHTLGPEKITVFPGVRKFLARGVGRSQSAFPF